MLPEVRQRAGVLDGAVLDEGDVAGAFLQIRGDVGGEQHAAMSIGGNAPQQLRQLVTGYRVQPAGGLIQDQQPGIVAQGQSDHVLYPHAGRQLIHPLLLVNAEQIQVVTVLLLLPVAVEPAGHVAEEPYLLLGIEVDAAQHHADALFNILFLLPEGLAQHRYLSGVRVYQPQNRLQCGGFARSVASDEAHDGSLRHGKVHVFQRKGRIVLAQPIDLQCVHSSASSSPGSC